MDFEATYRLALKLRKKGDIYGAQQLADDGLEDADEANDLEGQALMLKINALLQQDDDEPAAALQTYKSIEKLYIELNLPAEQMHTLRHIGSLFLELDKAECAEKCLVQVVDHYEAHKTPPIEKANAFRVYALSLEHRDQLPKAKDYWNKAKAIYQHLQVDEGVKECDLHLR